MKPENPAERIEKQQPVDLKECFEHMLTGLQGSGNYFKEKIFNYSGVQIRENPIMTFKYSHIYGICTLPYRCESKYHWRLQPVDRQIY